MSKKQRIEVMCQLIRKNQYFNQKELSEALSKVGFSVTQPTLSRDLNDLNIEKQKDGLGSSYYVLPKQDILMREAMLRRERISQSYGFVSYAYSANILVLKTLHGYANGLAVAIDEQNIPDVVGTVAGDDTIMVVLTENCDHEVLETSLKEIMPHFGKKEEL